MTIDVRALAEALAVRLNSELPTKVTDDVLSFGYGSLTLVDRLPLGEITS